MESLRLVHRKSRQEQLRQILPLKINHEDKAEIVTQVINLSVKLLLLCGLFVVDVCACWLLLESAQCRTLCRDAKLVTKWKSLQL
jgi:hypothetical protein